MEIAGRQNVGSHSRIAALLILVCCLGAVAPQAQTVGADKVTLPADKDSDYPPYSTDNINRIPDFTQSDERANFPYRGLYLCGIVAASNSLMWLDGDGFPELVNNTGDSFNDQLKLIRTLGLPAYTRIKTGTGITAGELMRGVRKYIREHNYGIRRLDRRGYYVGNDAGAAPMPELEWLKRGMLNKGAVWLIVGFYKHDEKTGRYRRDSGHWVTLVGYGRSQSGASDPNSFIIHDPSPVAGTSFSNDHVMAKKLTAGIVFDHHSIGRPASTCYQLVGLKAPPAAGVAILEEAVVLQLEHPTVDKTPSQPPNHRQ